MYNVLYYSFYRFSEFLKENIPGNKYDSVSFDGVFFISLMEYFNITALSIWLKIPLISKDIVNDLAIIGLPLLGLNSLYFLPKKRYAKIINRCKNKKASVRITMQVITFIYSALSIYFFILFI